MIIGVHTVDKLRTSFLCTIKNVEITNKKNLKISYLNYILPYHRCYV